jgi:hypothetical protein
MKAAEKNLDRSKRQKTLTRRITTPHTANHNTK